MTEPAPPWTRAATRPTRAEVDGLLPTLDPNAVKFARDATRPTSRELAGFRPRPRRSTSLFPASLAVAAGALALVLAEPTLVSTGVLTGKLVDPVDSSALFLVTPDQDVVVLGVEARGRGTVRSHDGRLQVAGAMDLVVHDAVVVSVDGRDYPVHDALVHVEQGLVVVEPLPVAAIATAEPPIELPPDPPPVEVPVVEAPARPAPVPVPVGPVPDGSDPAWREVLATLEARTGSASDRAALVRTFAQTWPASRFAPDAEALGLLLDGTSGPPEETLGRLEGWLARNPGSPRTVEVEALAARVAREQLQSCARARPHDEVVAHAGTGSARDKAAAFLGLCARAAGNEEEARRWLDTVDRAGMDQALRDAVGAAIAGEDR